MLIDNGTVQIMVSWGAIFGALVWIFHEIRKSWQKLEAKIDSKLSKQECKDFREDEKENRIREREAVKADREDR